MSVIFSLTGCVAHDVFSLLVHATEGGIRGLTCVASSLASGVMAHTVKACHEAFETGTDLDEDVINMMRHTFEARLRFFDKVPKLTGDTRELVSLLKFSDENLREYTSAVLVIDEEAYDNVVSYYDRNARSMVYDYSPQLASGGEWWQAKARLDKAVPRGLIENLLEQDR